MHHQNEAPTPLAAGLALAFLAIAVYIGSLMVQPWIQYAHLRNGTDVGVEILDVQRREVRVGDTTRTRVGLRYRYEFDGQVYELFNEELALFRDGSQVAEELLSQNEAGEKVACLVDPDYPTRHTFSTKISGMYLLGGLFPLFFGGFGILIASAVVRRIRDQRIEKRRRRASSD